MYSGIRLSKTAHLPEGKEAADARQVVESAGGTPDLTAQITSLTRWLRHLHALTELLGHDKWEKAARDATKQWGDLSAQANRLLAACPDYCPTRAQRYRPESNTVFFLRRHIESFVPQLVDSITARAQRRDFSRLDLYIEIAGGAEHERQHYANAITARINSSCDGPRLWSAMRSYDPEVALVPRLRRLRTEIGVPIRVSFIDINDDSPIMKLVDGNKRAFQSYCEVLRRPHVTLDGRIGDAYGGELLRSLGARITQLAAPCEARDSYMKSQLSRVCAEGKGDSLNCVLVGSAHYRIGLGAQRVVNVLPREWLDTLPVQASHEVVVSTLCQKMLKLVERGCLDGFDLKEVLLSDLLSDIVWKGAQEGAVRPLTDGDYAVTSYLVGHLARGMAPRLESDLLSAAAQRTSAAASGSIEAVLKESVNKLLHMELENPDSTVIQPWQRLALRRLGYLR